MQKNLWSAAACVVAGVVLAVVLWPSSVLAALVAGLVGLAVGGAMIAATLRREPHTPWAQARDAVEPGRAVIFWKPTCPYCTKLRRALVDDPQVVWVNVWADRDANREVRLLNDGDEYVPTAIVGAVVLRNPSADQMRAALA